MRPAGLRGPNADAGRLRRLTGQAHRRLWWVTFGLTASLFGLWSLASPLMSAPDEGAHVIAATAIVRGQLSGPVLPTTYGVVSQVEIPEFYARVADPEYHCYAYDTEEPAGCAPRIRGSQEPVRVATHFLKYPPLPYAVMGLPTLLPGSVTALRLMRLIGALLCAALVASGLVSAASLGRGATLAATLLAVTPMVAFLAGSVNTSGLEIAAAIALWPSLLALLERGPGAPTRLVVRAALAAGALAVSRPVSPLWLALIGAAIVVAGGRQRVRALLGDRRVRLGALAVGVVTAAAVAYVLFADSLARIGSPGRGQGLASDLLASTGTFEARFREMFGVLGLLDTPPPMGVFYLWVAVLGGLLLLALVAGEGRRPVALALTAGMVYAVPLLIEAVRAQTSGFPWQGRYTLPLAVGVPILAGWVLDGSRQVAGAVLRRTARVLVVVACGAHLAVHVWSTRRYVAGLHGRIVYFLADGWDPPVPAWLLLCAFLAVVITLAVWIDGLVHARAAAER